MNRRGFFGVIASAVAVGKNAKAFFSPHAASAIQPTCSTSSSAVTLSTRGSDPVFGRKWLTISGHNVDEINGTWEMINGVITRRIDDGPPQLKFITRQGYTTAARA